MRLQEQRTPNIQFSHLLQQQQIIRGNLEFPSQANPRMIEQIQSAKRKLNNSSSTAIFRTNTFFNPSENNRNIVNVQQRQNRSNNFYGNQPTTNASQSQLFRRNGPQVPEEEGEYVGKLRKEINDTRKENDGLKQVIAQNDASARFAISQLEIALETVKAENERIKVNFQMLSKQTHDQKNYKNSNQADNSCFKCPRLESRIRDLEAQIAQLNLQLDKQQLKRSQINQSNSLFRTQLSQRLRNMQEKLLRSNEQVLKYESTIHELSRKVSQYQQKEFSMQEQFNTINQQLTITLQSKQKIAQDFQRLKMQNEQLKAETDSIQQKHSYTIQQLSYFTNKIQAINADIADSQDRRDRSEDFGVHLGELEERVSELKYRLDEKIAENRQHEQKIHQQDSYLKRISEEYSQALQKIEHLEEAANHYKQRSDELQSQLDKARSVQSPANLERNQLEIRNQHLQQTLQKEQQKIYLLTNQIYQKESQISLFNDRLQQSNHYNARLQTQSQRQIRVLRQQILSLESQQFQVSSKNRQIQSQLSDVSNQLTQLKTNKLTTDYQIQQLTIQRDHFRNKVQQYQEREKEFNKTHFNQYKQNTQLQTYIAALQQEMQRKNDTINIVSQQRDNVQYNLAALQRENERLRQEIIEEQRKPVNQPISTQYNIVNQNLQIQIRKYEQDNQQLTKEVQTLRSQKEQHYKHLEQAQNYIATLIEQISQLNNNQGLQEQLNQKILENKEIQNILEQELRSKRTLQTQIRQLKEEMDHLSKRAQNYQIELEDNKKQANLQISRIQQTYSINRTQLQTRLIQTQKKLNQVQIQSFTQPKDPNANIELNNLKIKNQELYTHLTNAQNYIVSLEERIQQLLSEEQGLRLTLSAQASKRDNAERLLLSKQTELQNLSQQLNFQKTEKDRSGNVQGLVQSLQKNVFVQQVEIKRLNALLVKEKDVKTHLEELTIQTSNLKKTLAEQRTYRETIERQSSVKQAEDANVRRLLEQQKVARENVERKVFANQVQIKRLQALLIKDNNLGKQLEDMTASEQQLRQVLAQERQERERSEKLSYSLQIELKRLSSQITRASTDKDQLESILNHTRQQLDSKQQQIYRLSSECQRISTQYQRVSRQFQRLSGQNQRISQQLQFNIGERNKDLTTYERQVVDDYSEREHISVQQQRMRQFSVQNQQLKYHNSQLSNLLHARQQQILALKQSLQNIPTTIQKQQPSQDQTVILELQRSLGQSHNAIRNLQNENIQLRASNQELLNMLRAAQEEIFRLAQHLEFVQKKIVETNEIEQSRRNLVFLNERANEQIKQLTIEVQNARTIQMQLKNKSQNIQRSLASQNQNLKGLLALAQRDIQRLRSTVEEKSSSSQKNTITQETLNKVLEQSKNQTIIAQQITKQLNAVRLHEHTLQLQVESLNGLLANSENQISKLQKANQQLLSQPVGNAVNNTVDLSQELNRLREENELLRRQLENAEQEIHRLSLLNQQMLQELGNKQAQLFNLYNQPPKEKIQYIQKPLKDNRQVQFQALNRQLLSLQQQNTSLKISLQQLNSQIQSQKPSNPKFNDKSLQSLIRSNQQKLSHINQLTNKLISLQQKTITGQKEKQFLRSQLENKNNNYEDLNNKIGVIVDQCQAKLSNLEIQLQDERTKLNKYKAEKEKEIKNLSEDNAALKRQIQQNKAKQNQPNPLLQKIQQQNSKLAQERQFFKSKLIQAEDYIHTIQTHSIKLEQELLNNNQLAQQVKILIQKLNQEGEANSKLTHQNRNLLEQISSSKSQINDLKTENDRVKAEHQILQNNLIEAERYIESIQTAILPQKERQIQSIEQELVLRDNTIQQLRRQIQKIILEQKSKKVRQEPQKPTVVEPTISKDQFQIIKKQRNFYQNSLVQAERHIEQLHSQILPEKQRLAIYSIQLEQILLGKDQTINQLQGDIHNSQEQLKKAQQIIKVLELTNQNNQNAIKQLKQKEIPYLQSTISTFILQLEQANKKINSLELTNQDEQRKQREAQLAIQILQKKIDSLTLQLSAQPNAQDLNQFKDQTLHQIQRLRNDLDNYKPKYQNSLNEIASLKRQRTEQLAKLDQQLKLVQNQLGQAANQTNFFKNKLTEAEDFITYQVDIIAGKDIQLIELNKALNDRVPVVRDNQSLGQYNKIKAELQLAVKTVQQQNLHLQALLNNQNQAIGSLQSERNQLLGKLQQQSAIIGNLQANINSASKTIQEKEKAIKDQQKLNQQDKNKAQQIQAREQKLKQSLQALNQEAKKIQDKLNEAETDKQSAQRNLEISNKIKDQIAKDAQFLRNKLAEAEQYIEKLPLLANQQEIANLNQEIQNLTQKNKSNEEDSLKVKAALESKTLVLNNLEKELQQIRKKVKQLQNQIIQLNADKKTAEERVGQMDQQLRNVTADAIFFRSKLEEAETYIAHYLQQPQQQTQPQPSPQIESLKQEIKVLTQTNQRSEAEKNQVVSDRQKLNADLQQKTSLIEELKKAQEALRIQLGEAEKQKAQLISDKKKAEENVRQVEKELKQATQDSIFFRNKLDQAEKYIFYLEAQRNQVPQPIINNDTVPRQLLQNASARIDQLQRQISSVQNKSNLIEPLIKENQRLQSDKRQLQEQRNAIQKQLLTSQIEKDQVRQRIIFLQNLLHDRTDELEQLKKNYANLQSDFNQLQQKNNTISCLPDPKDKVSKQQLTQIQNALKQVNNELNQQRQKVGKLLEELQHAQKIKAQNQILANQNQIINQRLQQVEQENKAAVEKRKQSEKLFFNKIKELEEEKKRLIETEDYLEKLQEEKNKTGDLPVQKDLVERQQLVDAENEIRQLEQENYYYKQAAKELEELKPQLEALREENNAVKAKLEELQGQNKLILEKANTSEALLITKINQIEQLKSKIPQNPTDELENELATASNKIIQLLRERDSLIYQIQAQSPQLQKLANQNQQLSKENNEFKEQLQRLKNKSEEAVNRADNTEKILAQTANKLNSIESELVRRQQQLNSLRKIINTPDTKEFDNAIHELEQQRNVLQGNNKSLEEQVERLKKIKDINDERLQSKQDEIRLLHETLNKLTNQPKNEPQATVEDAAFFKSKLLQAQKYIQSIQHINFNNEQTLNNQNDEIKHLQGRQAQLEAILASTQEANKNLANQLQRIKQLNRKLNESDNNKISPQQFLELQSRCKDLQDKIKQQIKENQRLQVTIEGLNNRYKEQLQQIDNLKKEKDSKDNEVNFFKEKLFAAESYITELEEADNNNTNLAETIKELNVLQEEAKSLKKDNEALKNQNQIKNNKIDSLEKQVQEIVSEGEFFRKKLLQAQTYIKHLQQEMPDEDNIEELRDALNQAQINAKQYETKARDYQNRNKELTLTNQQLLNQISQHLEQQYPDQIQKLENSLVNLQSRLIETQAHNKSLQSQLNDEKSSDNLSIKVSQVQNSQFFKEKLLQAQSYIRQLEEQNSKFVTGVDTLKSQVDTLKAECEQRNQILQQRQERIQSLIEQLVTNEQEKEALRLKNIELEQKLDPLSKKVEILDGQLVREQQANNQVIKNLANDLETAQGKLQQANLQLQEKVNALNQIKEQKEAAEDKAKRYQDLSNTLQQTMNLLDSINRPSAQQEERIQKLRQQLRSSEEKLLNLTISNGAKDNILNQLQIEVNRLQTENQDLQFNNKQLQGDNATLQYSNKELLNQIQQLQRDLQEEDKKYNQRSKELQDLTNKIKQAEQQKIDIKSSKEIADQEHETAIKELEKKINEQLDDNKQIETKFLQQQLSRAQELILQQQNEINKLTEDIIRYQDTKQRDDDLLSTKKKEEQRLDSEVRQLSNSRQLLQSENKRLHQENEQLAKLASKLQNLEQEITNLSHQNEDQVQKNERQDEKVTLYQDKLQKLQRKSQIKEQKVKLLEQSIDNLLVSQSKGNEEAQALINQLESKNKDLEDQISILQQQMANIQPQPQKPSPQEARLFNEEYQRMARQVKDLKEQIQNSNKMIDFFREESQNLKRDLDQQLNQKSQAQIIISDLQSRIKELESNKEQIFQQNKNAHTVLTQQIQSKNNENNELTKQIQALKQQRQSHLAEIAQLQDNIVSLKENDIQPVLNKLRQAENQISQLEVQNYNLENDLKNLQSEAPTLRQEVENLRNQLRKASSEKEKLISEIKQLNNEIEMAQSDNERLNSKVSCLQSIIENKDHQIADLSEFSKDLNRDKNEQEKNVSNDSQPQPQNAPDVTAPIIPNEYQDSVPIKDEKQEDLGQNKEELSTRIKDLQQQIQALNNQLESINQQNHQLLDEKSGLQVQNQQLRQRLNAKQNEDTYEELRQHLVEADRNNLELEQIHQHLLNQIQSLAKDKAHLEEELKNISPQNSNFEVSVVEEPKSPIENIQQPSKVGTDKQQQSRINQEIQTLKQQLAQQKQKYESLLEHQVENQSLRMIKRELENKLQEAQSQKARLLAKLKEAEDAIARLHNVENELKLGEEQILKQKQRLEENLLQAELRITQLEQQHSPQNPQSLGENLKKILDLTNNFNQEVQPEDITQHLQDYPYLNEFINSILYRLRLSTALELQKSIKIKQLTEQLQIAQKQALEAKDLKTANEFLRNEIKQLQQSAKPQGEDIDKQKYQQVLNELVYYQTLNKQLQEKLEEITEKFQQQQKRIDGYQQQISILQNSSVSPQDDLSKENYELRKKLQSSQKLMQQFKNGGAADSSASVNNTKDVFYLQFLKTCLDKVVDLQNQVKQVYRQIQQVAVDSSQRSASRIQEGRGSQENTLQDKLQELQDKLLKNAQNIREHQQKSDHELFDLLKELTEVKELPEINKNRIEEYLQQLENQILREHDQHFNQVSKLRDQLATSQQQSGRSNQSLGEFHRVTRQDLLKEINYLNNSIEIYHQESMRRKKNYKRTLQSLLRDIEKLKQKQEEVIPQGRNNEEQPFTEAILQITDKLKYALEKDEEEDAKQMELGGDDFIISPNFVQILDGKENQQEKHGLSTLKENFAEYMERPHQSKETQTEEDNKPFLSFILSNQNLDKEDIRLLKKKISDMRAKDIEQNLQILRGQEKKLEEILQLGSKQNPQQLDNIMLTLANNYSRDEISQIFGSEDNDEIINKLNQALCMEDSFYKGENSSTMMKDILERKLKYYQAPTKLSEEVYTHLVNLLSAKRDDEFYDEVELLFRDLYEIEAGFEEALRKKDELYRTHNDRMNQIFNRSSSDGSQQYLTAFQRENNEDQLQMHSQRKPRKLQEQEEH